MKRLKGFKRLVAIAAASMLLCGFTCQAALGSGEETPSTLPPHVHAYSIVGRECTYTVFLYQHQYVVKSVTTSSGVEITYGYCDVVRHYYHDLYRCGCEDQYYGELYSEDLHMSCGQ